MHRIVRYASLALILAAAACTRDPGGNDPGPGAPADLVLPAAGADIIGTVTQTTDAGGNRVVRIEQDPTRSAGYPVATVHVSPRTRVLRRVGGQLVSARASQLTVGTRVRAWFTGPVRESYPVQADASTVLIEG